MGEYFEQAVAEAVRTFESLPDQPYKDEKGRDCYGNTYDAANRLAQMPWSYKSLVLGEIIDEDLDDGIDLYDIEGANASEVIDNLLTIIISDHMLRDPYIARKDAQRMQAFNSMYE